MKFLLKRPAPTALQINSADQHIGKARRRLLLKRIRTLLINRNRPYLRGRAEEAGTDGTTNVQCRSNDYDNMKTTVMKLPTDFVKLTEPTQQSELREMVLGETDTRDIPVYKEDCTPERRRPENISPGAHQQVEMSNNQWNCVDYWFGVCGKAESGNRSGTGSCWNCGCWIVWGYRVSCLAAIVIKDRLHGIYLFTEDRRIFTRRPGLVGNPVWCHPCVHEDEWELQGWHKQCYV